MSFHNFLYEKENVPHFLSLEKPIGDLLRARATRHYDIGASFEEVFVGGIVGGAVNSLFSDSYWNLETSNINNTIGDDYGGNHFNNVMGLPTEEMKQLKTYIVQSDWNFDTIWTMNHLYHDGYPYFRFFQQFPILSHPKNLSVIVDQNNVTLTWDAPIGSTSEFGGYEVYRNSDLLTPTPTSDLIFTDYEVENGVYVYGVTVVYEYGRSEKVEIKVIIDPFSPPNPVVLLTPENNATKIELNPVFRWELPTYGSVIEGLRFYIYHVGSDVSVPTTLPPDTIEYTLDESLDFDTMYYWYIIPFNAYGEPIDNQIFSFTTEKVTSEKEENILPLTTELLGNFPNPFNPATTIEFLLKQSGNISIEIYNIRGQRVISLVNEFMTSGTHFVVWNGLDDFGHTVGSGLYFYRMSTDEYVGVKRMTLLK